MLGLMEKLEKMQQQLDSIGHADHAEVEVKDEAEVAEVAVVANEVDEVFETATEEMPSINAEVTEKAKFSNTNTTKNYCKLCKIDEQHEIVAIKTICKGSQIVKGYKIFIMQDGVPLIGCGKSIMLSQQKILEMTEQKLGVLKNFDAVITEDMLNEAFENLKLFAETTAEAFDEGDLGAIDIYKEAIAFGKTQAILEAGSSLEARTCWYNKSHRFVEIRVDTMRQFLIEIGVTTSVHLVMKSLLELGYIKGIEILKRNGTRTQLNKHNNVRVYHFNIQDDLLSERG